MKPAIIIHLKAKSTRLKKKNFRKILNKPLFRVTFDKIKPLRKNFDNFLLTAQHKKNKGYNTKVINLNLNYFHSAELMVFMLFYEMVYQLGYNCPTISGYKKSN